MNHDANEFWKWVSPGLRSYLKLTPPTREEAEAEFQAAEESRFSEEQIQSVFQYAKTGRRQKRRAHQTLPEWLKNIDLSQVTQEMVPALARNAGAKDEEVEALLQKLREEALKDEGQDKDGEERSGLQGKAEPGEEGN